jgi:WhiB family transcriptional regulator, redox-sensing transcriptional regulator
VADFRFRARCCDDPELFYPIGEGPAFAAQIAKAKYICGTCPVRAMCLAEALSHRELHGIWGGTTTAERRELMRRSHAVHAA